MFENLIDIFTAPSAAFARLKDRPTILFPLLLIALLTASVQFGYFLLTDPGFVADQLIDQALATNPNIPDEQLNALRQAYSNPMVLAISSGVSVLILVPLILALNAVYLNFMSKFAFVQLGWKSWLSLVCWTGIPGVLATLASWAAILSSTNDQLPLAALNPLSFAYLLQLDSRNGPLNQLSLLAVWSMVLLVLGYQHWTRKSMLASALITLAPYVLIYGIWGLVTM